MKIKLITAIAASISLSACATVTKGSNDTVKMTSTPSEASILFEDTAQKLQPARCQTPCEIELNRKRTYKTTVSKEGYEDFVVMMEPKLSTSGGTAFAGNLLVGGLIGAGVDAATGASKDLTPNNLDITLAPNGGTSFAINKKGIRIESHKAPVASDATMTSEDDKVPTT